VARCGNDPSSSAARRHERSGRPKEALEAHARHEGAALLNLYNGMIAELVPYAIKGPIWYNVAVGNVGRADRTERCSRPYSRAARPAEEPGDCRSCGALAQWARVQGRHPLGRKGARESYSCLTAERRSATQA